MIGPIAILMEHQGLPILVDYLSEGMLKTPWRTGGLQFWLSILLKAYCKRHGTPEACHSS